MKKSLISTLIVSSIITLAVTSCGKAPNTNEQSSSTDTTKFKACVVSDQGGFDDKSFNESAKNGLDLAVNALNIDYATAESKGPEDFKKNIDSLISQKCDLVIGIGFIQNDAIRNAAKANPNVKFALVDSKITENNKVINLDNAKPILFNTAEAGFLAGYAAAGMSKTEVLATYGGMSIPSVNIFRDGFALGMMQYNKDYNKTVRLLGWDVEKQTGAATGNFNDQAKGKQLTESFMDNNADIILPIAGPVGLGTLSAVKTRDNVAVVWVDADGYKSTQYGDIILTSIIKEISQSIYDVIKEAKEGKFTNQPYVGTLANKGVHIAPFYDFDKKVPEELKNKISEYEKKIINNEYVVETKNQP